MADIPVYTSHYKPIAISTTSTTTPTVAEWDYKIDWGGVLTTATPMTISTGTTPLTIGTLGGSFTIPSTWTYTFETEELLAEYEEQLILDAICEALIAARA